MVSATILNTVVTPNDIIAIKKAIEQPLKGSQATLEKQDRPTFLDRLDAALTVAFDHSTRTLRRPEISGTNRRRRRRSHGERSLSHRHRPCNGACSRHLPQASADVKQRVIHHLRQYCTLSLRKTLEDATTPFQDDHRRPRGLPAMMVNASISIASRMPTVTCRWWCRIWMPCYVRRGSGHTAALPPALAPVSPQVPETWRRKTVVRSPNVHPRGGLPKGCAASLSGASDWASVHPRGHRSPGPTQAELQDEMAAVEESLKQYTAATDLTGDNQYWTTPYDHVTAGLKTARVVLPSGKAVWRLRGKYSEFVDPPDPHVADRADQRSLQNGKVGRSGGGQRDGGAPGAEPGGCQRPRATVPQISGMGETGGAGPWVFSPGVRDRCNTASLPAYTPPPGLSKQRPAIDPATIPPALLAIVRDDTLDLRIWSCLERIVNHVATVRPSLINAAHGVMNLHKQGARTGGTLPPVYEPTPARSIHTGWQPPCLPTRNRLHKPGGDTHCNNT